MRHIILFLMLCLPIVVYGQIVTLYTEDFSNDWKKGAITYGGITPSQPTDGNWSWSNVGSPDNDGGSASSWDDMAFIDGAAVMSTNGATSSTLAFRWNDVNNGSTSNRVDWFSKSISGAYMSITASLSYAIGNGSGANSVWAYYQIDGGAWTLFGSSVNQSTASGTFTSGTLSCSSSIKIKVEALTRDNNSSYVTIDNVLITGCAVVVPSVSIVANSSNICSGTSVTFTASPTNGGSSPSYQWKLNGVNVGTNSTTYTNSSLTNGNIVSCVMTSNATCASPTTATSNSITMTVTSNVTPSVSITSSDADNIICLGTSVTFTASPTNGGSSPSYQWKKNGINVGTNSTTYTNSSLVNNDVISCIITANNTCQVSSTANSNSITNTINSPTIGGTVSSSQSVYSGNPPNDIILTGSNGLVVKWVSSSDSLFTTTTDILITNTTLLSGNMGPITNETYYRAISKNGVCGQVNSSFVRMTIVSPLPIELLYFNGKKIEEGTLLEWVTATETNNDYFTIYRSYYPIEWAHITKIDGAGTSSFTHKYRYLDRDFLNDITYYYLSQTDFDGKHKDFEIIAVDNRVIVSQLIRITNVLGQSVEVDSFGVKFFHYSDGRIIKRY